MAGSASWEVEVVLSINDLKAKLEEAEAKLDAIEKEKHEIKLDIDTKLIESSLKKLDKLLDNLGKGSNNFEQFKDLAKQIESITNDVKTLSTAFGKIDDSSISGLLKSISNIDESLVSLSKHFSDIGNNSGANNAVKQAENITRANDEAAKSAEKLAQTQSKVGDSETNGSSTFTDIKSLNNLEEEIKKIFTDAKELQQILESLHNGKEFNIDWSFDDNAINRVSTLEKLLSKYGLAIKNYREYTDAFSIFGTIASENGTSPPKKNTDKDFNSKLTEAKTTYTELLSLAKQYDNATDELSRNNIMSAFESKGQEFTALENELKSFGNSVDNVNDKIAKMKSEVVSTAQSQANKSDLKDTLSGRKKEVSNINSSVDKQLQSLKDIRLDNVSYQSFFDNIKNQASDAARDIKEQISNGLTGDELQAAFSKYERTIKDFKEQLNSLNDVNSGFNSEKFDGEFGKFSSDLSKYGNLDTEGLQKARKYLQEYKEALSDIKSQMNGEISLNPEKLVSDFNQITQASIKFTNAMKQVKSETSQAVNADKAIKLSSDIKSFYTENTRLTLEYVEALKKLEQEAKDASTELERMNISDKFNSLKSSAKSDGLLGKSALTEFIGMAKRVITVAGVYDTFQMAAQEFPRQVYEAVKEVDTSMTNLYKVTDESESRYEQFLDKAGDSAKQLGRDMSSYIEQTATWAKLGYDLNESEELSKLSSIYANVGEVDDSTAVSDMVTAMKANLLCLYVQKCAYRTYLIAGNA